MSVIRLDEVLILCMSFVCFDATVDAVCDGQVLTEGRLILEFTFDDLMRIRMWHFAMRQHCELIPRGLIASLQVTLSPLTVG